ncbi:MAG: ShlB/FhaC/HecB family hemolysin secretion/activation protein [Flavisolibacter sp.]
MSVKGLFTCFIGKALKPAFFSIGFLNIYSLKAQTTTVIDSISPFQKKVIAGIEYKRSGLHQLLWGKDYRKEWTTAVTVPVLNLDSAFGGLTPVKEGGGRQTKSLHLIGGNGKRYMLRSVNKTYLGALPQIVQGTFVEDLANDQIATNHPYAALTVPQMADAAGVYHTNPKYFIVPYSKRLGEYNASFANMLCLLEERPDETQISEKSFGKPEDIVSTEKMMEKILEENDHLMDQNAYLKTRLFDMFIGDWGRHEDNWRWAKFDSGTFKIYRPVPKDRDQTYAKFEGTLLRLIIVAGRFKELQTFDDNIKNVKWYNYPAYTIDKRFTNQLSQQTWIDSAKALQRNLTDEIIEAAVRQMPPEILKISSEETIRKLKSRRDHLVDYATIYYAFLAKDVEVPGTRQNELFEIKRLNNDETSVNIYRINKGGEIKRKVAIYSRKFLNAETKQIRVYGVSGHDIFYVSGIVNKGIKIRVIGGPEKDSLLDISYVGGWGHKTKFYDNPGNNIGTSAETKVHLSKFPSVNNYQYDVFRNNSRGIKPIFYYDTYYRFYVGLGYSLTKDLARDGSFRAKHSIGINYSIIEKSLNPYYKAIFTELVGRWNFNLNAGYDAVRRFNYFGLGNETIAATNDISYYWLRLKNLYGSFGIDQTFRGHHNLRLDFLYNAVKVIDNKGRYSSKSQGFLPAAVYHFKQFAGSQVTYTYLNVNDPVVPTKGINFQLAASYTQNIKENNRYITKGTSSINIYLPLFKSFSIAIKTGGATLIGHPEFYQYNNIGGFYSLRGFWRYRFYGTSSFYDQNELRWLPSVKGYFFSGRIGLLAFFDQGRVWQTSENSTKWHYGYGGGVMMVPFNKIALGITYGFSEEGRRANIRIGKFF